jgi:hypothetical protein
VAGTHKAAIDLVVDRLGLEPLELSGGPFMPSIAPARGTGYRVG